MFDRTLDHRKRHRPRPANTAAVTSPALLSLPASYQPTPSIASQARQHQRQQFQQFQQ